MSKKNTTVPGRVAGFLGENSYIIVFVAIFIVYALTTNGLTWSGMMNVFRHSAVIGIIGLGMGLICITGEIDLSVGSMLALDGGFSVIIFNMTNSIILTFLFAVLFGRILRTDQWRDGRMDPDASIYRYTGNDADLSFFCTVFLPACG